MKYFVQVPKWSVWSLLWMIPSDVCPEIESTHMGQFQEYSYIFESKGRYLASQAAAGRVSESQPLYPFESSRPKYQSTLYLDTHPPVSDRPRGTRGPQINLPSSGIAPSNHHTSLRSRPYRPVPHQYLTYQSRHLLRRRSSPRFNNAPYNLLNLSRARK